MKMNKENISFKKASSAYKSEIFSWLEKPHVKEFWDNSPEHKQDILIFMNGRQEQSPYFGGIFDYWVGLIGDKPFCLIMASQILPTSELPSIWKEYISKTGKTFSIDFMIGNEKYLGKGLGAPTLKAFMNYFQKDIEPETDVFMIDPAAHNLKAIHVYERAGFKKVVEFIRNKINHFLMIKRSLKHSLLIKKS